MHTSASNGHDSVNDIFCVGMHVLVSDVTRSCAYKAVFSAYTVILPTCYMCLYGDHANTLGVPN